MEFFRPRGKGDKLVFKPYDQNQQWLVPPNADELIPRNHLVRGVNQTIDEMDLEPILRRYDRGGGANRSHPLTMFKVLVYGHMTRVYSSRMLAKAVRENVRKRAVHGERIRIGARTGPMMPKATGTAALKGDSRS